MARAIADGLEAGRPEISFPLRMALAMKLLGSLPGALSRRYAARLSKRLRDAVILYRTIGNGLIRPLLRALYRIDGTGWERIPAGGPAVLAASHDSLIDPFVLGVATPRVIHYMAKAELWRYPGLREVSQGFGAFPVRRGAAATRRRSSTGVARARARRAGRHVPAGHVPAATAAARGGAAPPGWRREAGVPLVPVCLVNTERAVPSRAGRSSACRRSTCTSPSRSTRRRARSRSSPPRPSAGSRSCAGPYGPPAHVWFD